MKREQSTKLIFSPLTAQYLLKRGYKIIDIKDNRNAVGKDVYVFEIDEKFGNVLESYSTHNHIAKAKNNVNTKLVFDREIAKILLNMGFVIVDLKKHNKEDDREVYVFEVFEDNLEEFLMIISDHCA